MYNKLSKSTVGVVGCRGDLGTQLMKLYQSAGLQTVGYDTNQSNGLKAYEVSSLSELQKIAKDIHWCAPSISIGSYSRYLTGAESIILHDSVMNNSLVACNKLNNNTYKKIQIVHMLMNSSNMVIIGQESKNPRKIKELFESLGCKTQIMPIVEHDSIMARSQAIYAILHELVSDELTKYGNYGLLTLSGEELRYALESRAANWTKSTMISLLKNPQLTPLLDRAKNLVNSRQHQ